MFQRLKNILIGEPLTHDDNGDEHLLSKIQALAMLSSDVTFIYRLWSRAGRLGF